MVRGGVPSGRRVNATGCASTENVCEPCKGDTLEMRDSEGRVVRRFIGVDGGGSKTRAVLVDAEMQILGEGTAGPSNHLRVGIEDATRAVTEAVGQALEEASVASEEITFAYCGIAGSDHPRHRARVVDSLRSLFPRGNFTVDSDARVALTGAVGFGAGIVVISGTGSVAFGRNEAGEEARSGGWGPTLGDEGSGYAIAREGLTAVVRAWDGRGPETLLTSLLCEAFGMCDPEDLSYFVYAASTHADDIARHCRNVIEAARRGDAVASEILTRAGSELGRTVLAVARQLGMLGEAFPVAWIGGAFHAGELLVAPMTRMITAEAPHARVVPPVAGPAMGAASMAIRASLGERAERPGA